MTACLYNSLMGLPFATWGEMFLVAIQCAIQVLIYWTYVGDIRIFPRLVGSIISVAVVGYVLSGSLPMEYLPLLGAVPIFLAIWSRLPQILLNVRNGHTGQLAFITFSLSGLGNLARVFTTLSVTPDNRVGLISTIVSAALNGTIVVQILAYWNQTNRIIKSKSD